MLIAVAGCAPDRSGPPGSATAVENAAIVPEFIPGRCSISVGGQADLRFTVTNHRSSGIERLLEVSTAAADAVQYAPVDPVEIAPGTSVAFGQRQGKPAIELEGLTADARPGTSVVVTFGFERLGDLDIRVPIEECRAQA
ncbi:hypothetical protein [Mycolicibacterium holsaticum]|nr:hypothetical protein [Mycolicibacterium holsaticum]